MMSHERMGRERIGCDRTRRDRGSATVWVLSACVLVVLAGSAAMVRTEAVLARHRAESAADLAALAAAGRIGIGIGTDCCAAARRIAAADGAVLDRCATDLDAGGRSGTVSVRVRASVRLPVVGTRTVTASARAARLNAAAATPAPAG